jgi:hypothetical protein
VYLDGATFVAHCMQFLFQSIAKRISCCNLVFRRCNLFHAIFGQNIESHISIE